MNKKNIKIEDILFPLTNLILFLSGAVNIGVGTVAALHGNVTLSGASLTAGLILLFAATIDRFESLKGLGVEAKTRQLDRKLEQEDDTLKHLRELAEMTGTYLIDMASKLGRWDSAPSPREAYALSRRVKITLTSMGSPPEVNMPRCARGQPLCVAI